MSEKRRALGRGLGALIPTGPSTDRPVDVFFRDAPTGTERPSPDGSDATARVGEHLPTTVSETAAAAAGTAAAAAGTAAAGPNATLADPEQDNQGSPGEVIAASATHADTDLIAVPGATFAEIPLDAIRPNPRQPRTVFDEDELAELVHSITEIGVLQPVVVRPVPADAQAPEGVRYELVMGERRWRASRAAGKDTVPAIIKATEEDDLLRDALLENLHRSQLNALEEAAAYQQLLDDFGCTQEELAQRIGRSRPQISNTLRLLKLPPLVARRVAAGVLSAGHARALLAAGDGAVMERLAQRVVAEGLSVRSLEEIVAVGEPGSPARRRPRPGARRPQLDDIAARLGDHLDTRVAISLGQRKGKVTVEFASVDDLHRILAAMGLPAADGR